MAVVVYEHPLNERIRTLLRLELLFKQLRHVGGGRSIWDDRSLIATFLDVLDLLSRSDIKNELLKELERALSTLEKLMSNPGVDHKRLQTVLKALESLISSLHHSKENPGQKLKEDPFLAAIRQRSTIPGGTCDFDLPLYHYWLNDAEESREADKKRWLSCIEPYRQGVDLLLKLLRNSSDGDQVEAENGIYQQALDPTQNHQLIRVSVEHELGCFAEISGGRHRFTVRFLEPQPNGRPLVSNRTLPFQLTICAL